MAKQNGNPRILRNLVGILTFSIPMCMALTLFVSCSASNEEQTAVDMSFPTPVFGLKDKAPFNADGSYAKTTRQVTMTYSFLKFHELKREGHHSEARQLLMRMVRLEQASSKIYRMLAEEFSVIGDYASALVYVAQAQKIDPNNQDLLLEYANYLQASKQSSEALLLLEGILEKNPAGEEALSLAVNIDVSRDDYWVALRRLDKALKKNPKSEFVHFKIGRVYSDMGKLSTAETHFKKALKLDPNYFQAMTFLALVSEELGKVKTALKLYSRLASETNNLIYHRKLGQLALANKKYDLARRAFENVLQNDPMDIVAHNRLLTIYMKTDKWASVESSLKRILSIEPKNEWARVNYALTLEGHKRLDEALYHLELIDKTSEFYEEHWLKITRTKLRLYTALDRQVDLPPLLHEISIFVKEQKDPKIKIGLYQALAKAQLSLSDYSEASIVLSEALTDFPESIPLLFLQGMVFEKQKKFDEGVEVMSQIITKNPDHAGALNYVGYTWADKDKNLDEAENYVKKALELQPGDPFILDSMGWVFYKQGKYEQAYVNLMAAFLQAPNEFVVVTHLADVLVKLGRLSEARDYYVRATHLKPDHLEDMENLWKKIANIRESSPELFRAENSDNPCAGRNNLRCISHNKLMFYDAGSPQRSTASGSR